jgi:hypothetical protein
MNTAPVHFFVSQHGEVFPAKLTDQAGTSLKLRTVTVDGKMGEKKIPVLSIGLWYKSQFGYEPFQEAVCQTAADLKQRLILDPRSAQPCALRPKISMEHFNKALESKAVWGKGRKLSQKTTQVLWNYFVEGKSQLRAYAAGVGGDFLERSKKKELTEKEISNARKEVARMVKNFRPFLEGM